MLLTGMAESAIGAQRLTVMLLLASGLISAGLLLCAPQLSIYRGSSGLDFWIATIVIPALWRAPHPQRQVAAAIGLLFGLKLVLDITGLMGDASTLPAGVRVVWQAHLFGVVTGCAMLARLSGIALRRSST